MKLKILLPALLLTSLCASAQIDSLKVSLQQNGKPIIMIFGNFHSEFADIENTGFEIQRAYLGYQYMISESFSTTVIYDAGESSDVGDLQRIGFLRNAFLTWKKSNFTLNVGLLDMKLHDTQLKAWGHRYIMRTFQDKYKFAHVADLGMVAEYQFGSLFVADVTFVNGEGFKKISVDPYFLYGAGLTCKPFSGLTLRITGTYKDYDHGYDFLTGQENLSCFAGYENNKFGAGVEYSAIWNTSNSEGKHQDGFSAFIYTCLTAKAEIFARWDCLSSANEWNIDREENAAILGFQYSPNKHIRISPNIWVAIPKATPTEPKITGYISLEIKL